MTKKNDEAEILIYEQIGAGFFEDGIGAKEFARELKDLGDIKTLTVRINSPGGSVFEGQAIYSQLKAHKAEKYVVIDGLAASIASVIAMAGDIVSMPKNATMMIHDPWSMAIGDSEDMRKMADALDTIKLGIIAAYRDKTKLDDETISKLMSDETWMTADDALGHGFVDYVEKPVEMAASAFNLSQFKNAAKFFNIEPAMTEAAKESKWSGVEIVRAEKQTSKQKEVNKMADCKNCGTALILDECPKCEAEAETKKAVAKA